MKEGALGGGCGSRACCAVVKLEERLCSATADGRWGSHENKSGARLHSERPPSGRDFLACASTLRRQLSHTLQHVAIDQGTLPIATRNDTARPRSPSLPCSSTACPVPAGHESTRNASELADHSSFSPAPQLWRRRHMCWLWLWLDATRDAATNASCFLVLIVARFVCLLRPRPTTL